MRPFNRSRLVVSIKKKKTKTKTKIKTKSTKNKNTTRTSNFRARMSLTGRSRDTTSSRLSSRAAHDHLTQHVVSPFWALFRGPIEKIRIADTSQKSYVRPTARIKSNLAMRSRKARPRTRDRSQASPEEGRPPFGRIGRPAATPRRESAMAGGSRCYVHLYQVPPDVYTYAKVLLPLQSILPRVEFRPSHLEEGRTVLHIPVNKLA